MKTLKTVIEEIGIATYGGHSFEPTDEYRKKLTAILTQDRQDILDAVVEGLHKRKHEQVRTESMMVENHTLDQAITLITQLLDKKE